MLKANDQAGRASIGGYVLGRLDAAGVPAKAVADKSRVHPSTLSRFFNGIKNLNDRQLFEIAFSAGLLAAELRQREAKKAAQA